MARSSLCVLPVVLLVAAGTAQANLFVCTDARGRTISADRPPPECADRPIRELRSDGSIRRIIEPPITPEQRAAREAEEKRRQQEAEVRREQMRRDLALLEAYANEQEIETTRNRALADRLRLIERAQQRRADLEKERKKLDVEAEFFANRELPERLKRSYETLDRLQASEDRIIADVRADMARINERFDAEAKRYRELVHSGATPRSISGLPASR
jgi:hypothetical protein